MFTDNTNHFETEVMLARGMDEPEVLHKEVRMLSPAEQQKLKEQNSRLVSSHTAESLEKNAKKHWDLFYKRNETRFFKDRHWTLREFNELLSEIESSACCANKALLEVGCGVGNLIFPLIKEGLNMFVYACDLSEKAVSLVKQHSDYSEEKLRAFQADISSDSFNQEILPNSIDIITMIFVLSAIHPEKFNQVLRNMLQVLKPGGIVLLRDYGLHDMAQIRFKPGHKIAENFYMRQDGTRSYYFSIDELDHLFTTNGFSTVSNDYIHRRTINKKEDIDVPRVFIQGKFRKPE